MRLFIADKRYMENERNATAALLAAAYGNICMRRLAALFCMNAANKI